MPRDASGTYAGPVNSVNPAVPFTHIESTAFNNLINDIETALTDSLDRTGDGAMQANLNMGTTFKIVSLADPTAAQDGATKAYVDKLAVPIDTTLAALGAVGNAINTTNKFRNKYVADENDRVWRSLGALTTSKWRPLDDQSGISDITPA